MSSYGLAKRPQIKSGKCSPRLWVSATPERQTTEPHFHPPLGPTDLPRVVGLPGCTRAGAWERHKWVTLSFWDWEAGCLEGNTKVLISQNNWIFPSPGVLITLCWSSRRFSFHKNCSSFSLSHLPSPRAPFVVPVRVLLSVPCLSLSLPYSCSCLQIPKEFHPRPEI